MKKKKVKEIKKIKCSHFEVFEFGATCKQCIKINELIEAVNELREK